MLRVFLLKPGKYYLNNQLKITQNDLSIIGMSEKSEEVEIIQTNPNTNGLVIDHAHRVTLKNLTVKVDDSQSVCLTVSNASHCKITNCRFYGGHQHFTVYFSGPDMERGQETLDRYEQGLLDQGNQFDDNIVCSRYSGDSLVFALQKNGTVRNNILRGGKLALYMVKQVDALQNYIYDTSSHGIIVSLPSKQVNIINNCLRNTSSASISVMKQLEHGDFDSSPSLLVISRNIIMDSQFHGIELSDTHESEISLNHFDKLNQSGIYLLRSERNAIRENLIIKSQRGVTIDVGSRENSVTNNQIHSHYPNLNQYGTILEPGSENNQIENNSYKGPFTSNHQTDFSGNTSNIQTGNHHQLYIGYTNQIESIF
jgi:parallel beta-helix repeat protein